MLRKIGLTVMTAFYLLGGINHFWHPEFYAPLIPPYLPFHPAINLLSGLAEIVLAIGLLLPNTRSYSAYGIVLLLILFIPSHVYFIQIDGCVDDGLCAPMWVAWLRLLLIHPLLMLWAWAYRK